MASFGKTSSERLSSCDKRLQDICSEAIKIMDFSIICGHRGKIEQDAAFKSGNSKVQYPDSKHNLAPSNAVDIAPYRDGKAQWEDVLAFHILAGIIIAIAFSKGIKLRWGGDWDADFNVHDQSFNDLAHFEIID